MSHEKAAPARTDQSAMTDSGVSPRIDEVVGYTDASLHHGVSIWAIRRAVDKGEIRTWQLPGNRIGLHREDVATWAERAKNRDESQ